MSSLDELVRFVRSHDPAAKSDLEVICCYPGIKALALHRLAHKLYMVQLYFLARVLCELGRWLTGIEIHPGAQIGKCVFIDHGMGTVIGETAVVGERVVIYHGVTLGGTGSTPAKRHPTICDNVIIGAHAQVLGNITIGSDAKVAAGAIVLSDVEPGSTVTGVWK